MIERIKKDLENAYQKINKTHRLTHVYGVLETALTLAKKYHVDEHKITLAALLHDRTKYYSEDEHIDLIQKCFDDADWIITAFNKNLLHAYSGCAYAILTYNITDQDILNAIMHHTVGKPHMSMLEEILFISDYIEPSRTYPSCVKVRKIAQTNLTKAIYTAMNDSITFFEQQHQNVPKLAYLARAYYQEELKQNEEN